jgi:hypothetical protein
MPKSIKQYKKIYKNKEFWEELIAYFNWYDTDCTEEDAPNILLLLRVYSLQR